MKILIKNARLAQKLKMREVAAAIQVDAALISHWEKGSRKPTRQQLRKLKAKHPGQKMPLRSFKILIN